ncbi:MAG TPA: hypothetical protein VL362_00185 [Patescibacteria group bacterium]|nr:hypothetical protein [Patescibacteria group bacterium]
MRNAHTEISTYEKFSNRNRKGASRTKKRKATFREMVRRAQDRIVAATRHRGNGAIRAHNKKDAVGILRKWVSSQDGKIGKGGEVYRVLDKAFDLLLGGGVLRREEKDNLYVLAAV